MINEEKNKYNSAENSWSFKQILKKICCCCPTLFSSENYYVDLGPIPSYGDGSFLKKTLVLDLDETLIYSTLRRVDDCDFSIKYQYKNTSFVSRIYKRPDLDKFLNYVHEKFDVVIFTASMQNYADLVIDEIAPWIQNSHRFYRQDCLYCGSYFIKDLDRLNRPLDSIIIVDDSKISFNFHNSNGILVSSFNGDMKDKELLNSVMPILKKLENASDVREVLKKLR